MTSSRARGHFYGGSLKYFAVVGSLCVASMTIGISIGRGKRCLAMLSGALTRNRLSLLNSIPVFAGHARFHTKKSFSTLRSMIGRATYFQDTVTQSTWILCPSTLSGM